MLATSRVPLGVAGEVDFALEPLATPDEAAPADEIERYACARLFLDRGHAVRRDLAVDADGLTTVARICRELDGLPLAIELAAAHAVLSVGEIADRLDNRMRFLRSWRRLADARHQTLRATIDWSYGLLPDEQRELLGQLSVFSGGFTLEAAAAVCLDGDGACARAGRRARGSVAGRRRGAFGRDALSPARDHRGVRARAPRRLRGARARSRHAEHFSTWQPGRTGTCWSSRATNSGKGWRSSMPSETTCTRRWSGRSRPSELALPLAVALRNFWNIRGYRHQGVGWFERALALQQDAPDEVHALAAGGAALLARLTGDFDRAAARRGGPRPRALGGRPRGRLDRPRVLTTIAGLEGDFDRARSHSEESMAVARNAESPGWRRWPPSSSRRQRSTAVGTRTPRPRVNGRSSSPDPTDDRRSCRSPSGESGSPRCTRVGSSTLAICSSSLSDTHATSGSPRRRRGSAWPGSAGAVRLGRRLPGRAPAGCRGRSEAYRRRVSPSVGGGCPHAARGDSRGPVGGRARRRAGTRPSHDAGRGDRGSVRRG